MNKRILAFVPRCNFDFKFSWMRGKRGKDDFKLFYLNIDITGTQAVSI